MIIILVPLAILLSLSLSCKISGKESGLCTTSPLGDSSFCGGKINQYVCIPVHNKTWADYDADYKDRTIQATFVTTLQRELIDEYERGNSSLLIGNNPACYNAYWKFICQWNFPRCSKESNVSLPICASVCNDFYSSCGSNVEACSILFDSIDLGLDQTC